jgi:hypothetical protein
MYIRTSKVCVQVKGRQSLTQVVKAQVTQPTEPDSDGSCASGEHQTRIGCCPDGTTNVHSTCQDPEQHRQDSDKMLCAGSSLIPHPAAEAIARSVCH